MDNPVFEQIRGEIDGQDVVLFMKGSPVFPQCGFSAAVVQILSHLGVKFKVCGLAAQDYDYSVKDFYEFIDVVPSAITELSHWQQQGYSLIVPVVKDKKFTIEEIR